MINTTNSSKVGIAITQWNHAKLTEQLLATLIKSKSIEHIAVCDNGSDDSEYFQLTAFLEKKLRHDDSKEQSFLTLVKNQNNSGFSIGTNLAISRLLEKDIDWIWLLNNDTNVSESHLDHINQQLRERDAGIYGTSIDEPGIGPFTGAYLYNYLSTRHKPIYKEETLVKLAQSSKYISGASIIVHRSVFEAVGLLSEDTFLYYEELDFCFRARLKGFDQHFIAGAMIKHLGAGSSTSDSLNRVRIYNETWSLLNFYHNHKRFMTPWIVTIRMPVRIVLLAVKRRFNLIASVLSAVFDYYRKHHKYLEPPSLLETKHYRR